MHCTAPLKDNLNAKLLPGNLYWDISLSAIPILIHRSNGISSMVFSMYVHRST